MTTLRLETILAEATLRAARADFDGDVPCCTEVVRSGLGGTFGSAGDGLDTVDSAQELSSILSLSVGRARIVNAINYCAGTGTNIIGCASTPGNGMVLVRLSGVNTEAVLWIHEYGHNLGLDHSNTNRDIMFGTDTGNNDGLTVDECQAFHSPSGGSAALLTDIGACTDDGDTWADPIDNCPSSPNEDQADSNGNGIGDVCEACPSGDTDADAVCNAVDNCPATANSNQGRLRRRRFRRRLRDRRAPRGHRPLGSRGRDGPRGARARVRVVERRRALRRARRSRSGRPGGRGRPLAARRRVRQAQLLDAELLGLPREAELDGGAMYPASAEAATTAGEARYPSPPTPIRFCQFRLNDVIARCPGASASGPCPKHGPHHESRIAAPAPRSTLAIDSPPSRGSGFSMSVFTPPEPGKTTKSFTDRVSPARLAARTTSAAARRSS
jgi:hypothetical protein